MPGYLILGMTYAFAAAVQPGPLLTFLIAEALTHGRRRALPIAFAPLVSDGPVIVLVLAVLSRVPAAMIQWLRVGGGLFVLYLAWGALTTWRKYDFQKPVEAPAAGRSVLKAALLNLLNPNPYIAWSLVLGPLMLNAWRDAPSHAVAFLAAFYSVMVTTMAAIAILFAGARRLGSRVSRGLVGASSLALAGFGVYLLYSGLA